MPCYPQVTPRTVHEIGGETGAGQCWRVLGNRGQTVVPP